MDIFKQIEGLTSDSRVELGQSMKELLNKELCLGMTRYVCRNGTLSDGHEKITPAQRYFQSIKEIWSISGSIKSTYSDSLIAQADLLDAKNMHEKTESERLRKKAAELKANDKLLSCLVMIEDQMRQLDEFNKVRLELQEEVRAKYPLGIEQAEKDGWAAVAKYRHLKRSIGYPEQMTHVPLDMETKARLGIEIGSPDLQLWMMTTDDKKLAELAEPMIQNMKLLEGGKLNG